MKKFILFLLLLVFNLGYSSTYIDGIKQQPEITGAVTSVNGETGEVILTQDNIVDGSVYVKTNNNFTDTEKTRLSLLTPTALAFLDEENTFTGNVGIGTTPAFKLDVSDGDIFLDYNYKLRMGATETSFIGADGAGIEGLKVAYGGNITNIIDSDNSGVTAMWRVMKDSIEVATATELIRVQEDGNVGIGTNTPASRLHVAGNMWLRETNPTMYIGDSAASNDYGVIGWDTTGSYLKIGSQAIPNTIVVDTTGKVGIGTSTPSQKLHVASTTGNTNQYITSGNTGQTGLYFGNNFSTTPNYAGIQFSGTDDKLRIFNSQTATNHLVIDNNGDITMSGYLTSKKSGVFGYISTPSATTITTAGTYYPIQGEFTNILEGFGSATVNTPGIKYNGTLTRYFEIDLHAQIEADSLNTDISIAVYKNGELCTCSVISTMCRDANSPYAISSTSVIELEQNDEIQLMTTSDGNGDQLTFVNLQTTIRPFF